MVISLEFVVCETCYKRDRFAYRLQIFMLLPIVLMNRGLILGDLHGEIARHFVSDMHSEASYYWYAAEWAFAWHLRHGPVPPLPERLIAVVQNTPLVETACRTMGIKEGPRVDVSFLFHYHEFVYEREQVGRFLHLAHGPNYHLFSLVGQLLFTEK